MLVLGIDPGTRITGFGAVLREGGRFHSRGSGVIKPRAADPLSVRLLHLTDELDAVCKDVAPDECQSHCDDEQQGGDHSRACQHPTVQLTETLE